MKNEAGDRVGTHPSAFIPHPSKASPTGFEPVISCVTGRRALRAAPRGRIFASRSLAQVGLEPTASFVLSEGGLPIAYRAQLSIEHSAQGRTRTCKLSGLSRTALPLAYLSDSSTDFPSSPGWTRTTDCHFVRVLPLPLNR